MTIPAEERHLASRTPVAASRQTWHGAAMAEKSGGLDLRAALLTPAAILVVGVMLSAFLIPAAGWPGLAPLVLAALTVVIWTHASVAAVENQWNELRAINWNTALPAAVADRRRHVDALRANITGVLRPAVERVGGLLKATLFIGAIGLAGAFVVRISSPEVGRRLAELRAPLATAGGLILLLMLSLGWSILRLRRVAQAVGEVFVAIERAIGK
jgi:hypothetical protein